MLGLKDELLTKLHEDHEEVAGLMEQILKAKDAGKRGELFRDMKAKLLAHAKAEQKILYKPMEKKGEDEARKFALEGDVEHGLVEQLLDELGRGRAKEGEPWTAKFTVLKEMVEHHVEEEESTGFKAARQTFDADELDAMGERFAREKEKLI
jgi:hemerythrin superfamily protein